MAIYTVTLNPALDRQYTVPALIFDDVLRSTACRVDYGGKGFNVSRAVAALGGESVALGFVGGATGQQLVDGLAADGILVDFVQVAGETRTNTSIVTEGGKHYLKVNEPGPTIQPEERDALRAKVRRLARPGDWWVLAGSLPPGLPVAFYAELIALIQGGGARAVLDSSGPALRAGCEAGAWLVKPNLAEAAVLTGLADVPPEAHLPLIHGLGARHVVLSMGADGALLSAGATCWRFTPPHIVERNPIGAGDALVGGMIWRLAAGDALPDALRWGMAAGACAAERDGTDFGSLDDLRSLYDTVAVERCV